MAVISKPHVVCVPFPLQGHIIPMLKFAKLLHSKGFHVTFVNTEFNHDCILDSRGPNSLNGLPDFRFATIPLQHPPSNSHTSLALNLHALRQTCRKDFLSLFRHLVADLNNDGSNPRITCMLSDAILNYSLTLSEELHIPNVLLWNMGASGFMSFKHSRDQIKQCIAFLKDPSSETGMEKNLESMMEWIPGMKGAKLRDLSKFIKTKEQVNSVEDSTEGDIGRALKASAVIFHTFDALESETLKDLSLFFKKVFSIGPLQLLLDQIPEEQYNSIECNLWNEEAECIKWLHSKEANSVIYVNFGSTTVMTAEQVVELAWGLANSNHNFLWITRPDLIMGESAILPPEFLVETKERGFIASWCPQEEILNHPSTAGFMTHCGWNSILETISSGTPIIGWPFFGEHFVNSRKSCNEWGIGTELGTNFQREDVEKLVKELMEEEKGKKMKEKAMEWKKLAEECVNSNGSSSFNFNNLVNEVLLSKN
ncbi:7-deoxyloganetin glucosyltransferase-like [Mercurialis annua]|uniref:7-deoxyloganetin glucosyltransferase-like n=1 Tax=Mercurialis annua TaxID=3986 RepID=UPI0021605628|nr:7-deoxyloganetin glucosyltransferase-like [Mercurialis annua]